MKYTSKQVQIYQKEQAIYEVLSCFSNFTPILADKVEEWEATDDRCSFKAQGFKIGLKMDEKIPYNTIKVVDDDGASPIPFAFWIQLKEVGENDTRMRIVLDVELNMMMKAILGGKLQDAVDKIAEQVATAFNTRPETILNTPGTPYVN